MRNCRLREKIEEVSEAIERFELKSLLEVMRGMELEKIVRRKMIEK